MPDKLTDVLDAILYHCWSVVCYVYEKNKETQGISGGPLKFKKFIRMERIEPRIILMVTPLGK